MNASARPGTHAAQFRLRAVIAVCIVLLCVSKLGAQSPQSTLSLTPVRPDGAIVGRLSVPSGGFPLAFGNDRVVLRTEDADGVVALSVRRIGVVAAKLK